MITLSIGLRHAQRFASDMVNVITSSFFKMGTKKIESDAVLFRCSIASSVIMRGSYHYSRTYLQMALAASVAT